MMPAEKPPAGTPSEADSPAREPWGWTRRQRLGLGVLLSLLLFFLTITFVRRPHLLAPATEPAILMHNQRVALPMRIDPNTASAQDLARIPHLGDTLASRIIDYRNARRATAKEGIVFRQPDDLLMPGIGKRLVEQLTPFLQFPDDAPATHPF